MKKTNAARQLDKLGLRYEVREYEVDLEDLSAPTVAAKVGLEPAQVYKTLVLTGDTVKHFMAIVAADAELDLKAAARASGNRKAALVALKDVQPLTGYVRGGVTALAAKKRFDVVADESLVTHDRIAVSAGVRGQQLVLDPKDYVRAVEATLAPIQRR
ncbi:MAG: Cys-tRNA(Pro) deacylase [Sandaracinaceae bacterium]|nr:Cys-tRNA(Pro) deacylase [Sandaracinaceae bacterium]